MRIFCAIVGHTESVFPIEISERDFVADLKRKAKIENPHTIQCDAFRLQVFLAEKNNAWMTEADVKRGVDTDGLRKLQWATKTLRSEGLSAEDIDGKRNKEAKLLPERGGGAVNVLLVVPAEAKRRPRGPEAMAAILPLLLDPPMPAKNKQVVNFKDELCQFYGCYRRRKSWVRCMQLNVAFPQSLVVATHVFRRSDEDLALSMLQISDIDDVKNGLLLFKPLDHAFSNFQISFIKDDQDAFRLKLFDPTIRDLRLIDLKDRSGGEVLSVEQMQVLFHCVSNESGRRCLFDTQTTFGDVDGSTLTFTSAKRPFYRCLNLQARLARTLALDKHWIDASYDFPDHWSDVSLDGKMEMFHRSLLE